MAIRLGLMIRSLEISCFRRLRPNWVSTKTPLGQIDLLLRAILRDIHQVALLLVLAQTAQNNGCTLSDHVEGICP